MLLDKDCLTSIDEKIELKKIFDELGSMLLERLEFADDEIAKAYSGIEGEWVNDDSYVQAMADKRLVEDMMNIIAITGGTQHVYNGKIPNKLSDPIYKDERTNALNLLAFLKLGLNKMEIMTKCLDADNMRSYNQQYGYSAGDQVLQKMVKEHYDQGMVVFRTYGDNFFAYNREELQAKVGEYWKIDWEI